ncbi:MAG TPA: hypothetical protein EYQ61_10590 [Dehalococcoidia bacterium]|jgi:uncharacterized OsmC-like protein|nr:hypothetical protein [Dehalococcoidia bacterium]HIK88505.1 hypothetical protein [Dehalococcoidia bacterium]
MTGTFGGALEARGIPAGDGFLYSESEGQLEKENNVLVIKRIHVTYHLNVEKALYAVKEAAIQRAFDLHPDSCPVYRSIYTSIDITKELDMAEI